MKRSPERSMADLRPGLYRSYATINLPAKSACNDSAENSVNARARLCFKVQKSSRTARSKQHGLLSPDRGQVTFPACVAKAASKAASARDLTDGWIIGLNDVATIADTGTRAAAR